MKAAVSPRWRKLAGDVRTARGRMLAMLLAMAVSIATVTAMLAARSILTREMGRNFRDTHPASAVITLGAVDAGLLASLERRSDLTAIQAEARVSVKIQAANGTWLPMVVRIIPNITAMRIDTFKPKSGAWPPAAGELLIERSGVAMLGLLEGAAPLVETASGVRLPMPIAGLVHDAGQPPSTQEQTIWAYAVPSTLPTLAGRESLNLLKVVVPAEHTASVATIERVVRPLAQSLRREGHRVERIDIATPNEHPHQWQFDTIGLMLLGFGALALVLEAVLMATILTGLLAPQVREIAVMKTLGARTSQIAGLYLALVGCIAGCAAAVGIPLGVVGGDLFSTFIARILNLEIASYAVPWWLVAGCIGFALLLPLGSAWWPIRNATRRTVREGLDDRGVAGGLAGGAGSRIASRAYARWLARVPGLHPVLRLAIYNSARRGSRLLANVLLLTFAGALFIVACNQLAVWRDVSDRAAAARRADVLVFLRQAQPQQAVLDAMRGIAGVLTVEPMDSQLALVDAGDQLVVTATPNNSLTMNFVAPNTQLLALRMIEGRWLDARDSDAVVLNAQTRGALPEVEPGNSVTLLINGHPVTLRVVGIVEETLTRGAGYTTANVLDRVTTTPGRVSKLAVASAAGGDAELLAAAISKQLTAQGFAVRSTLTRALIERAQSAHVHVLLVLVAVVVLAVAVVGTGGLATALMAQVVERTREIGIMRAVGASERQLVASILAEAALAGVISWLLAVLLSVPLTVLSVQALRRAAQQSLPLQWSIVGLAAWLLLALVCAAAASVLPAKRAAALTVRQALSGG